ncbi:anoctamin-8-like isoform X1 [Stylophora pistillata]|uniref:anoctamin-8-like isoform X1 n=1 Tax=Stylophora pistillata TaxID=50429 RepID=UPI000C05646C|nr:anoctamin-8-like isoform X1 [Stylophora pistillata]
MSIIKIVWDSSKEKPWKAWTWAKSAAKDVFSGGKGEEGSFQKAGKFVLSSKLWEHSTPSKTCDVLITFPKGTEDYTVMWLLSRLRARVPDIDVHVRQMAHSPVYGFYLTSTFEVFLQKAEELGLKKKLRTGGITDFKYDERDSFENSDDPTVFFKSGEKQSMILEMVNDLRAVEGDELGKIKFVEGQQIVPKLLAEGVVEKMFPLHNSDDLAKLKKSWVSAFFKKQPLDDICEYFGVKIAMYFAWLGMYTKWLIAPTVLGIITFILSNRGEVTRDWCILFFNIFNIVWATLFLEAWKRKSAELAYKWGTMDMPSDALKEPRPLFRGDYQPSEITGRIEAHYPSWKRNIFRYCVSLPIILTSLGVVLVTMLLCFEFQRWVDGMENPPKPLKFAPKIALAVCIGMLDDNYKKVAYHLNDKENYRLQETYENHLIIKLVSFQFFNAFLALFYIAFYLRDMDRLKTQLAALLITKQVVGNVKEALVPFVKQKVKEWKLKKEEAKAKKELDEKEGKDKGAADKKSDKPKELDSPLMNQAEIESTMAEYEDTFEDYLEMFIQFGYVVLFSSAFPLAALCALLNNIIEIRSDAFKLCTNLRRPFGERVENIGTWQDAMEVMGVVAVMVNLALLGMGGSVQRMFPNMTVTDRIILIVVLEHLVLGIKFAVAYAIPDIPEWVENEIAKMEFQRREALKSAPSTPKSPKDPQAKAHTPV